MKYRLACLIVTAASLSACASGPYYRPLPPTAPTERQPAAQSGSGAAVAGQTSRLSGPTATLLGQSRDERDAGDLDAAAATIERALAIAPDEAALWVELAEIHFERGDLDRAEEMARKALTLTPAGTPEAERARRLIAR